MTSSPRFTSLRDYIRVLRAHRVLIVLMTVVFAVATYAVSKHATKTYQASASVALQNPTQAFALAGLGAAQNAQIPLQTPAINAEAVSTPPILGPVVPKLRRIFPHASARAILGGLEGAVSGRVSAANGLVVISAAASKPQLAAKIANDVAGSDVAVTTQQVRLQLQRIANGLQIHLATIRRNDFEAIAREQYTDTISRLQGLARVISGGQVVARAATPVSASSPKPTRNALLAALAGLTLAIVVSFLHASLDRRVRNGSQIRHELDVPLLGRVPESALGGAGPSANGRKTVSERDLEAFRIIRANLDLVNTSAGTRVLAVTSPLPEQGKSTVAASLAFASASAGRRTLLIESDLRRPSLAKRMGLKPKVGLTDLISAYVHAEHPPIESYVQKLKVGPGEDGDAASTEGAGLEIMTAGSPTSRPAELLAGDAFRSLLADVRERYEFVVLDTPPVLPVADALEVLPQVETILVCVRVGRTRTDELHALRAILDQMPDQTKALVVTGVRRGDEVDYGYYAPART